MLTFPELSRKPALKTRSSTIDPTIRDNYENGMESTRARGTRQRRQWDVSMDLLTPEDVQMLEDFTVKRAVYGANIFLFADNRDPKNPQTYRVRFSQIPAFNDAGNVKNEFRQNCTFQLKEV